MAWKIRIAKVLALVLVGLPAASARAQYSSGAESQPQQAIQVYLRAANLGNPAAQTHLAEKYFFGDTVARDEAAGLRWMERAASEQYAPAQHNFALMLLQVRDRPAEPQRAFVWMRRAAESGFAPSQFDLGVMYARGIGVDRDARESVRWFRKAAAQGSSEAIFSLGLAYDGGRGVPQDYAKAAEWYRRAARAGMAAAENNLGILYLNGLGVARNCAEALRLFRLSAAQANSYSYLELALVLSSDCAAAPDYREAYFWVTAANLSADRSTPAYLVDQIAHRLTPEQQADAQHDAERWVRNHPSASRKINGIEMTLK